MKLCKRWSRPVHVSGPLFLCGRAQGHSGECDYSIATGKDKAMEGMTVGQLIRKLEEFGDDMIVGWYDDVKGWCTVFDADTTTEDGVLVLELQRVYED